MRIVIAPDKFKGSLTAPEVAERLHAGLLIADPGLTVDTVPVADGGEGTLDAALAAGFDRHTVTVSGPTGEPIEAPIAIRDSTAVIEMALASGLAVLPGGVLRAREATSLGTGELIRYALDSGCTNIVLGVGGSANTDGGAGMLTGLGAALLDDAGSALPGGGAALADLAWIDLSDLDPRLATTAITLASDVDNPLLGTNGAAAVFGPQKGATPDDVAHLDGALARFVEVLEKELGPRAAALAAAPGAGAAGGVGYAALAVLNAERRPGIDVVLELTGLAGKLDGADLVITGEGSLDEQSLGGKTPLGVAMAAGNIPVIAVCGRTTLTHEQVTAAGFKSVYALTDLEPDVGTCIANAGVLLEQVGQNIAASIGVGAGNGGKP
ncbi:glycerate kinase [Arthrobacter sp. Soil782]|uniref:glycerate kinase n=1 Tax=Arthrobacter sp. Soil782 TaxID=1736410 RepID=UPI00070082AD|nr:glycerate kinase [Arthrobacter sp. Soil782]KRF08794.1 glycerate kinase [Arthrobacter sp. Soil782]